jgi:hypothetical protein
MKILLAEVEKAGSEEELNSMVAKAGFYKKIYDAYTEMQNNSKSLENLMDKTYLMLMLSKAIESHPELRKDAAVANYCNDLESYINQSQDLDFQKSKEQFSEFLASNSIQASDIGYDPNYKSHVDISLTKNGLNFKGGWLDQLLFVEPPPAQTTGKSKL